MGPNSVTNEIDAKKKKKKTVKFTFVRGIKELKKKK